MTLWFSTIPSWASFVIIVALSNVVALGAAYIARRLFHRAGVTEAPGVVNAWGSVGGALCSMLFAFTIVTMWNGSTATYANVEAEAGAVRMIARDIAPSQLDMLRTYVDDSVAEWPQLCGGSETQAVSEELLKFERLAKPRSEPYANDLFSQLGALEDARTRRWQSADLSVPNEIWVALIVLALALYVVLAVAMPSRRATHVALMIAVATAVGALIWVATVLQYPFCGRGAITPDELISIAKAHFL